MTILTITIIYYILSRIGFIYVVRNMNQNAFPPRKGLSFMELLLVMLPGLIDLMFFIWCIGEAYEKLDNWIGDDLHYFVFGPPEPVEEHVPHPIIAHIEKRMYERR